MRTHTLPVEELNDLTMLPSSSASGEQLTDGLIRFEQPLPSLERLQRAGGRGPKMIR